MKESGLLPVLARLVKGFSARHSPRAYAVDLVAALHTTLRLLTRLNSSGALPLSLTFTAMRDSTQRCGAGPSDNSVR